MGLFLQLWEGRRLHVCWDKVRQEHRGLHHSGWMPSISLHQRRMRGGCFFPAGASPERWRGVMGCTRLSPVRLNPSPVVNYFWAAFLKQFLADIRLHM